MKLRHVASWSEIISSLAIVGSLIFVGVQVYDNTVATRSSTAIQAHSEFLTWYRHVSKDLEIAELWLRGVQHPETLTEPEFLRYIFLMHTLLLQFQNNYYLVQQGTLEDKVLNSITVTLTTVKGAPGFDSYWELRKGLFYPEYKLFIEELMYNSQYIPSPTYVPDTE